ncbi:MAG: hypothetical protein B6U76_06590 [Desulfurococcales archaeon ex4484_217_2]|nr:MAG: hypothetical protein B6U76_06590 [Desulfurococcales archaeon ex4484_217_2]
MPTLTLFSGVWDTVECLVTCLYRKVLRFKIVGENVTSIKLKITSDIPLDAVILNGKLIFAREYELLPKKEIEVDVLNIIKTDGSENSLEMSSWSLEGTYSLTIILEGEWDTLTIEKITEVPPTKVPIVSDIIRALREAVSTLVEKISDFLVTGLNTIVQMTIPIWNTIASAVNETFLRPLTDMVNFLIQRFVERFEYVVAINFAIPTIWELSRKALMEGKVHYLGFAFLSPIIGMVIGKFLKALLKPKPFSIETLGFKFEVPQLPQVIAKAPMVSEYVLEETLDYDYEIIPPYMGIGELEEALDYRYFVYQPQVGVLEETLDYEYFVSPAKEAVLEETLDYEYSTSLADVVSPETYEPTGGWDNVWRFTSTLEIDDFANYSKAYTDIDVIDNAKFMVFNPPDGEIGNARRKEDGKVWARVGVALKVSLDTMEVATTICSVYTSDGTNYAYVSITTMEGNLSQLKLSEYTGNAQVFDIPPDGYIILIVDFESMTATVYDKDGNVLAQIPIGVTSSDITEAHVGMWEENISGHVVENVDVDWVAVKYGAGLGTPSHVLRTADLEETLDYEYSVTTPTAVGTMVKKPTLISSGVNI